MYRRDCGYIVGALDAWLTCIKGCRRNTVMQLGVCPPDALPAVVHVADDHG